METDAQDIVGKWKYTREFFDHWDIHVLYPNMWGYCKFMKNGSFVVRINGSDFFNSVSVIQKAGDNGPGIIKDKMNIAKGLYVKIKGTYTIHGNAITTHIPMKGVKVHVDLGREHPFIEDPQWEKRDLRTRDFEEDIYESRLKTAEKQAEVIKSEKMGFWLWENVPIEFHGDTLCVDGIGKLVR